MNNRDNCAYSGGGATGVECAMCIRNPYLIDNYTTSKRSEEKRSDIFLDQINLDNPSERRLKWKTIKI